MLKPASLILFLFESLGSLFRSRVMFRLGLREVSHLSVHHQPQCSTGRSAEDCAADWMKLKPRARLKQISGMVFQTLGPLAVSSRE
jgi:hypothetical protein